MTLRVRLRHEWATRQGLLAAEPRVRTLRKVLVTYPEVRHILPDRIRLEAAPDGRTLESLTRLLLRQQWLVTSVVVE